MIDFTQLTTKNTIDALTNPRDLFNTLTHKDVKYQYPCLTAKDRIIND
jgi:hypothetical protein